MDASEEADEMWREIVMNQVGSIHRMTVMEISLQQRRHSPSECVLNVIPKFIAFFISLNSDRGFLNTLGYNFRNVALKAFLLVFSPKDSRYFCVRVGSSQIKKCLLPS